MQFTMTNAEVASDSQNRESRQDSRTAEVLREALQTVQLSLRSYAADAGVNLELEGLRWGAPDITASWCSGGYTRNVQVSIAGHAWPLRVVVYGAAWIDSFPEGKLQRVRKDLKFSPEPVASAAELQAKLRAAWPAVFGAVQELKPVQAA